MLVDWRFATQFTVCCVTIGLFASMANAQSAPRADLVLLGNIPVPNWTTSGTTQANFDLFAFNPRTRIMYFGDRTNKSVTAIDASTNQVIGVVALPSMGSTNGVVVAPELQDLIVTDGQNNVFVYDLRVPSKAPDQYVIPNITSGTDALDYNPLNRTVYVINGTAPYYMTGIDLVNQRSPASFCFLAVPS
jgi:DNA-binding beta-propeller fold protein YncE